MSKKTSKKELLKIIEDDIVIYMREGTLSINNYLNTIDTDINNLEKILKLHFLLDEKVKKFILDLNKNIKKFNNSITRQEKTYIGKIVGNVSWGKTIQVRNNINPKDKSIFVCNENIKNYNTKENIVLKTFLEKIYDIFQNEEIINCKKYEWFSSGKEFKRSIENIYLKNIYLSRIDLENIKLNNRIIEDVCKSRSVLYSEAAKLLKYYNKIMSLDKEEIKKMLRNTFIEVADESTLFELYWVLKIIKDNSINKKLYILDDNSDKVAEWEEDDFLYTIYHNSTGSKDINFIVGIDEIYGVENEVIKKQIKIVEQTNTIANKLFENLGNRYMNLFNGRPDIIIEKRKISTNKLVKVIIGEVKHTVDRDYSIQGLKELIEYVNFIKYKINDSYDYITKTSEVQVKGMLLLDNIKVNKLLSDDFKVYTMFDNESKIEINF